MIHFAAKIERNDPCWCGSGKKYKSCHMRFDEKIRGYQLGGYIVPDRSIIKTPEQIKGIKESAKVNMACLDAVAAAIHPGMSTEGIDKIVYETTVSRNAIPAPLHYERVFLGFLANVLHRRSVGGEEETGPGHQRVRGDRT